MQDSPRDWKNRKDWKCGKCGKTYTFDEFIKLMKIKLVDQDTDPISQHGYTVACECGYRFLLDRWRLNDIIKLKIDGEERDVLVSTVDLELNHGFEKDLWYETMVFVEDEDEDEDEDDKEKIECYFENRYETKEEAIKDHNIILDLLKNGKYRIEKIDDKKELNLEYSFNSFQYSFQ